MNTPLPEFLRGVKPGDSPLADPRGRIILFEFPHGERYPNQLIRQWKLAQGLSPNEGVVMQSRYRGDQRYPYRTKHNQYFIWMSNERALINTDSAIICKSLSVYQKWRAIEERNRRLIELPTMWVYPQIYRHTDPVALRHTGEILVLIGVR
jgi:hypothetical protein